MISFSKGMQVVKSIPFEAFVGIKKSLIGALFPCVSSCSQILNCLKSKLSTDEQSVLKSKEKLCGVTCHTFIFPHSFDYTKLVTRQLKNVAQSEREWVTEWSCWGRHRNVFEVMGGNARGMAVLQVLAVKLSRIEERVCVRCDKIENIKKKRPTAATRAREWDVIFGYICTQAEILMINRSSKFLTVLKSSNTTLNHHCSFLPTSP